MFRKKELRVGQTLLQGKGDETSSWTIESIGEVIGDQVTVWMRKDVGKVSKRVIFKIINGHYTNYDLR
jgi:hypothetical protein